MAVGVCHQVGSEFIVVLAGHDVQLPALAATVHEVPLLHLQRLQLSLQALQVHDAPAPQQAARKRVDVIEGDAGQFPEEHMTQ